MPDNPPALLQPFSPVHKIILIRKMQKMNEKPGSMQEQESKRIESSKAATDMAVERTMMAADRSLMAWVRTGLSLISFGFTIYKFLEYQRDQLKAMGESLPPFSSPKMLGLLMIGIGVLCGVMGTIENQATVKGLQTRYEIKRPRYALFVTAMITIIGIVLFAGIIFKVNGIV
jgi:putative membrane protein